MPLPKWIARMLEMVGCRELESWETKQARLRPIRLEEVREVMAKYAVQEKPFLGTALEGESQWFYVSNDDWVRVAQAARPELIGEDAANAWDYTRSYFPVTPHLFLVTIADSFGKSGPSELMASLVKHEIGSTEHPDEDLVWPSSTTDDRIRVYEIRWPGKTSKEESWPRD